MSFSKTQHIHSHAKLVYNVTDQQWKLMYRVGNRWTNPSSLGERRKGEAPISNQLVQVSLNRWSRFAEVVGQYAAGEIDVWQFAKLTETMLVVDGRVENIIMRVSQGKRPEISATI